MRSSTSISELLQLLLGLLAGALGFVVACEALFRVLPVSTATKTNYDIDPALLTYPPHHEWRTATGWDLRNPQRLRSNNVGYVADSDFVLDSQVVALIGDSYVEASMLDAPDRPGPQLRRFLGNSRAVYPFGGPGSSLLDYAERIRFARQRFGVRDFVVFMEAGDVRQALCGSGNVHSACLDPQTLAPRVERRAQASLLKRVLRESAFAQYVTGQLRVEPDRLMAGAFTRAVPKAAHEPDSGAGDPRALSAPVRAPPFVDVVTATFFERVAPYVTDGRLVIVVDGQRRPGPPKDPVLSAERSRFIELARERGARIADAEPLYVAHFARSPLSLDVGPYDGHLNALGVRVVMAAAASMLR